MKTRIEIIEEADGRWPNYHSESHYRLSGGFIEGATWLQENPTATGEEYRQETERRFPLTPGDDDATRVVNSEFKEGFIYGVAWMRQVLNSETTPEPEKQYKEPMDIPWFREAVERSERILRETPKNSRPTDMQERYKHVDE